MHVTVYSAHPFEKEYLDRANHRHQLTYVTEPLRLETAALATGSEAVVLFTLDDASGPVLEKLHALGTKYVATRSAGYDHVDVTRANALGMKVARVPAYSPYAIAEHATALILALNRKLILAHERINQNNFSLDPLIGFDLNGKTAGIIGLGTIGKVMAKILNGFGCNILAYDVNPTESNKVPVTFVSLEALLSQSDIISLHAPYNAQTKYLINARSLALCKPGVMLINTSRGGLVNTQELISALRSGQVGAAGLDVYEHEKNIFFRDLSGQPLEDELFKELRTLPNVLITGHQAFLTSNALGNIADTTLHTLDCWENGIPSGNELT
ncbi:2-hydroxyacid dehydrogenase [Nibribacter koreensis]|uniref:2-hydroxyacid dehydrogenase n=1 Tax=Nibribacter koreensis TaxID=1084519 RepID=A0ABP8F5M4_9BACT